MNPKVFMEAEKRAVGQGLPAYGEWRSIEDYERLGLTRQQEFEMRMEILEQVIREDERRVIYESLRMEE